MMMRKARFSTVMTFHSMQRAVRAFPLAAALLSFVVTLAPIAPAQAQGSGVRIGYVNTERILRDALPAKAAQQKLEREFSARDKELQALGGQLKATGERLERDRAVMSESERRDQQRDFAELEKDFQRKQREFREDLSQRRNEELAQVLEKANGTIRSIAEAEKYDLVIQEAVYAGKQIDITDKVIDALAK